MFKIINEDEEKRLHGALPDHPDRFGPMCRLLTGIASRYGRPGADGMADRDLFVGETIVEPALRMDGWGKPTCLPPSWPPCRAKEHP